uniref:Uncharacterized protein n=1 Tax=Anguilla anguilla TaxID=7936 RepID=A0A0E9RPE5_ANGAN
MCMNIGCSSALMTPINSSSWAGTVTGMERKRGHRVPFNL